MIDAERHRIRRELIRVSQETRGDKSDIGGPRRFRGERSERDMADALAAVAFVGDLIVIVGCAAGVLRLLLPVRSAAIAKDIHAESREDQQGHDGQEQSGAKGGQEAGT
jgi:hypothetical protein